MTRTPEMLLEVGEKVIFQPTDKRLGCYTMSFAGQEGYVVSWMPFEGGKYLIRFNLDSLWLKKKHLRRKGDEK